MKHLAVVTPFPPTVSGIADYGYFIVNALHTSKRFEQITVLTDTMPHIWQLESASTISVESIWKRNSISTGWRIAKRLQSLKPDLVWYNLGMSIFGSGALSNLSGLLSLTSGVATGLPTVVTIHEMVNLADTEALQVKGGVLLSYGKRFFHYVSTTCADVVCVTLRKHANWITEHTSRTQVVHIPHGAYNVRLLPEIYSMELLAFASWAPFKGLERLLAVFDNLRRYYPSLRLTVAGGEHPRFPGYLDRVRQLHEMSTDISWLGYVPEHKLADVFGRATIVILPYATTTGASSVLYRAAAWGRPIVASDLPELRATAEEEGLQVQFYPPGDANALSCSLLRLLSDSQLRSRLANHNYHIIAERLTLADTCRGYLSAFDLALAARKNKSRLFSMFSQT